ncbi:RES family NAD+ phosphorylase [Rhizobium sp. 32-5/1]|uniref:RES family NAD+ phosphorylase n=1 Tax=Rhizobium sp. 32-5/1 TaxID=3019602 RepID=UPI00240D5F04|nr:RES family NAD+ phosphorylase [Rhizobium sp. 32-5/1]WEZ84252.1 RES family NAD+ phosphorylase [Rhizobium sp. 32-5/1]
MILWRISNYANLSGTGGLVSAGRWHEQGIPVVYCCDHPSTCLLEILVHVDIEDLPDDYQLLKIDCPDDVAVTTIPIDQAHVEDLDWTRREGSRLLGENSGCLIRVPSAVMPEATNFLINPRHPDAGRLTIAKAIRYPFDSRLLR